MANPVSLELECASQLSEGLIERQIAGLQPRVSDVTELIFLSSSWVGLVLLV